jgi:hypothetical protein
VWEHAEQIARDFVPLALDGDCGRQPAGAAFLKRIAAHFANEWAVVTPNGQVLAHDLKQGLEKWRALPEAERRRLDDLGKYDPALEPAPPPKGLIVQVYARGLSRAGDGWALYRHPKAHLSREPGRDHLWLTEAEWRSLIPQRPQVGDRAAVSAALTDRLCRRYLIDLVRIGGEGGPRRREDVLGQELTLTVVAVTEEVVRLRLEGAARYRTRGREHGAPKEGREDAFTILGHIEYDRKADAVRRFDVVALCPTGHYDEVGQASAALGVAFELSRGQTPAERARPSSYFADYFGKGR